MSDDNAKYAADEYELVAMNLLDAVCRHELRRSGEAGGVLVSEHLFMCLEVFKQANGGMEIGHTLNSIDGLPLGADHGYDDAEWYVFDKEEWLGAMVDGDLEFLEIEP